MALVIRCRCGLAAAASSFRIENGLVNWIRYKPMMIDAAQRRRGRMDSMVQPRENVRRLSAQSAVQSAPVKWQPYLRLMRADKPAGTWLLYWPGAWSIALAAGPGQLPDWYLLALFGAGAFLMRSAGCVINDLYDKDFDRRVERTKSRPLASGELTNWQAMKLLSALLGVSFCILLQLNWFSIALGAASLLPVATYPLFKRFTYWPQMMLGLTMNWGCLLGWPAVKGGMDPSIVLPLYLAAINWTMVYDTIYAHQDKTDDVLIGVKSTALRFGDSTKWWLSGFGAIMIGGLFASGYQADLAWPFYAGVGATAVQVAWQVLTVNINKPDDCWKKFTSNRYLGLLIFLSITLGNYCK